MAREISAGCSPTATAVADRSSLLVHPGGPFWSRKDAAGWSIPRDGRARRGQLGGGSPGNSPRAGAADRGEPERSVLRNAGGKLIVSWLVEADLDVSVIQSNRFEIEWPPRSAGWPISRSGPAGWFDPKRRCRKSTRTAADPSSKPCRGCATLTSGAGPVIRLACGAQGISARILSSTTASGAWRLSLRHRSSARLARAPPQSAPLERARQVVAVDQCQGQRRY